MTVACQDPLSMGFTRQEYWSGLPFLSPRDLPDPDIEPRSPLLAGGFSTAEALGKPYCWADEKHSFDCNNVRVMMSTFKALPSPLDFLFPSSI